MVATAAVAIASMMSRFIESSLCGRCLFEKWQQQLQERLGLLLLYPVAGAVDEMGPDHARAERLLHGLECTRTLIDPPVAPAADEHRGHVDRPAREDLQLGRVLRV